jgi:hypothetical protein
VTASGDKTWPLTVTARQSLRQLPSRIPQRAPRSHREDDSRAGAAGPAGAAGHHGGLRIPRRGTLGPPHAEVGQRLRDGVLRTGAGGGLHRDHVLPAAGGQVHPEGSAPLRAAGAVELHTARGKWPVEEDFEFGKDCFGVGPVPRRACTPRSPPCWSWPPWPSAPSSPRCSKTAPTQAPPPGPARSAPPAEPGMIPLTIPETKRLLAALTTRPCPGGWKRP